MGRIILPSGKMYRGSFQASFGSIRDEIIKLQLRVNMGLPIDVYLNEQDLASLDALRKSKLEVESKGGDHA